MSLSFLTIKDSSNFAAELSARCGLGGLNQAKIGLKISNAVRIQISLFQQQSTFAKSDLVNVEGKDYAQAPLTLDVCDSCREQL